MSSTKRSGDESKARERAFYCARCLTTTTRRAIECAECGTPFMGPGGFDRLFGSPPAASSSRTRRQNLDLHANSWFASDAA